jgi:hypothetical protein
VNRFLVLMAGAVVMIHRTARDHIQGAGGREHDQRDVGA